MTKLNYYSKMKEENKLLRLICCKYSINLDKEPLFLNFLGGGIPKSTELIVPKKIKEDNEKYIVRFI